MLLNTAQRLEKHLASAASNPLIVKGEEVDGRTATARKYRDTCGQIARDLGGDVSTAQLMLIKRAAALSIALDALDARLQAGEQLDPDTYVRFSGALVRVLDKLGIGRTPRQVNDAKPGSVWAAQVFEAEGTADA